MSARQLRLFDPPKPLLELLGRDFFRAVPARPGVYVMSNEADRVLYVGQSGNLRARLGTYKNAHPDRVSRKLIRLVHAVRKIVWQECSSAVAALVRENELLRTHRPKFNVINTYPQAYSFIGFKVTRRELLLCRTTDQAFAGKLYGAFKAGGRQAFSALLRWCWAALRPPETHHDFPRQLLDAKGPRSYAFPLQSKSGLGRAGGLLEHLPPFLEGTSADLLVSPLPEKACPFLRTLRTSDLESLSDFYRRGPQRNHELKERHQLHSHLIPQDRLDDLLALGKVKEAGAPAL